MTKHYFHHRIYSLLFIGLVISSCTGPVNTNSPKETTHTSQSGPIVIGTPPSAVSNPDPLNDPSLVSQYIRSIFQDSKGNLWFGPAGQSVARYSPRLPDGQGDTLKYFSKTEFFQGNNSVDRDYGNSVHAIAEDKNGNIWFGTEHGAIKYDPSAGQAGFRSYTEKDGLSNTRVSRKSILTDQSGDIWVGTLGGVFRYNPAADTTGGQCFSRFHLLPPINVKDIMEDSSGNIWFASQDKGVFRYDPHLPEGHEKAIINITAQEGLGDNYAGGMAQDKAGNFWFTMKDGICRYDGKSLSASQTDFTCFTTKDGIGGSEIWGIYIEQSGIIWITARGSTTRFDPSLPASSPKAFTVYTVEDGLNCCVQSMYQDRSGRMWWGTGQGLYRFDGKRFHQVKQNGPW